MNRPRRPTAPAGAHTNGGIAEHRLLGQASIDERYEVTRRREVPIARLTPHHKPTPDGSVAFSGSRLT